jgi:hypothetical protein
MTFNNTPGSTIDEQPLLDGLALAKAHEDRFDMSVWVEDLKTGDQTDLAGAAKSGFPECGTAMCLAGFVVAASNVPPLPQESVSGMAVRLICAESDDIAQNRLRYLFDGNGFYDSSNGDFKDLDKITLSEVFDAVDDFIIGERLRAAQLKCEQQQAKGEANETN